MPISRKMNELTLEIVWYARPASLVAASTPIRIPATTLKRTRPRLLFEFVKPFVQSFALPIRKLGFVNRFPEMVNVRANTLPLLFNEKG
jgi:hypothetical protein